MKNSPDAQNDPEEGLVHVFFAPEGVVHSGRLDLDNCKCEARIEDADASVPLFAWHEPLIRLAERHPVRYVLCTTEPEPLLAAAPAALKPLLHHKSVDFRSPDFGEHSFSFCALEDAVQYYAHWVIGLNKPWILVDSTQRRGMQLNRNIVVCDSKLGLSSPDVVKELDKCIRRERLEVELTRLKNKGVDYEMSAAFSELVFGRRP